MNTNEVIEPQILQKYQIIKKIGSGAYGHVWKVYKKGQNGQRSDKKIYALKKIFQAFQHSTDAQRTFREISLLKKLNHSSIISLSQVHCSLQNRDVYLLFQYIQTDLYHAIYQSMLQKVHKRYIIYQLLIGIKYLHMKGVIHRDLKPSNLLLDTKCQLKICDFGLARLINSNHNQDNVMTQGVATRWYRAPEVLLGSNSYAQQADIWSIGCIMAQMHIKNPIFPGSSTINQLQKILQFTGKPQLQDIQSIKCQYAQKIIGQCGNQKQKSSKQFFGNSDTIFNNLIYKVLQFNPQKRLTIDEMLKHEFFIDFYNEDDLIFDIKKLIKLQVDDNIKLSTQQYKELIQRYDLSKRAIQYKKPYGAKLSLLQIKRQKSPIITKPISKPKQLSPSHSPQRFRELKKSKQPSFSKLLASDKVKKRSDSKQSISNRKERNGCQLFSQIIKDKDSRRSTSKQRNLLDKENIHSNNMNNFNMNTFNTNNCVKRFENLTTTSRVSFQGLKKTSNLKFNR